MGLQTTVLQFASAGVPGELYTDAPVRAASYTLVSALASYNVIGATAYTITSEGVAQAGSGGGLGFAGILANPKVYALNGTSGNALAPTLTLPNQAQGELVTTGTMWITLPNTAAIGDYVIYNNTTGALSSIAPGSVPVGSTFANAVVSYFTVTAAGIACITISPKLPI